MPVVYIRHEYENGAVTCRLVASKSKVVPLTPTTVPRLELMAAVMGLRLTQSIVQVLGIPMRDVSFYSDSMDVLWWIRGRGKDFRAFVVNRIGEIQSGSDPAQWQHVRTDQNPADVCTRGASPTQLAESSFWWEGPDWLTKGRDQWPKMKTENRPENPPEIRSTHAKSVSNLTLATCAEKKSDFEQEQNEWRLDPKRFSDWSRLTRLQARVRRALFNMRHKGQRRTEKELTSEDPREAEMEVIRAAQSEVFGAEYSEIKKGRPISAKSQLVKLNPIIDADEVSRSQGCLSFAEQLPYDVRCPIILPRGHRVTRLIVKHYHEKANHAAGVNFILSQLSERFWIIAAREEIRDWENQCYGCRRRRNKPASQVMAPLPGVRLRFTYQAFDQCAVDFGGPFITIQGRGRKRQKRYLCMFTCLSVRAVHLEKAWSLDTDAFLNAFARFTSRRGVPKEVVSDNGTNFVGAVNELKELAGQLDEEKIKRKTSDKRVRWLFNPPAAPHFGGAHEIMVKAAKKAIYAVLSNSDVNDEELITIFTGAESLINSRPLTYQSADVRDLIPLTPNHFLYGQMGGQFAPEAEETTGFHPQQRWRKVQHLISLV